MKASTRWRPSDGTGLRDLHERGVIRRAVGIYCGDRPQKDGPIAVMPVQRFLEQLPSIVSTE